MHISWLGSTSIRIQTKPKDEDLVVVIDPYKPEKGEFPRSLTPNIALFTRGEKNAITLSGEPFVLNSPGECDIKGVLITSTQGHTPEKTMIRIDTEQMSLGHCGLISEPLNDSQMEVLTGVDILIIPVGGKNIGSFNAEAAAKLVNAIEPRIVIPVAFKSDNDPEADPVEPFLKELGAANLKPETKIIIKQKDLPQDETRVVLLSKE